MAKAAPGDACSNEAILKAACGNPDLAQLELESVQSFLKLHSLPASDASLIYTLGRTDMRSEIRAIMFARILDIISLNGNGTALSPHQSAIFNWFRSEVWQAEKSFYQKAVNDRNSWSGNPCTWTPDADVAKGFGLKYKRPQTCDPPTLGVAVSISPNIPSKDYYLAAALKTVYGTPLSGDPNGLRVLQQMNSRTAVTWGATASAALAATIGSSLVSGLSPQLLGYGYTFYVYSTAAAVSAAEEIGADLALLATVEGSFLTAFVIAVVALVAGTIEVAQDQETLHALQDLDSDYSRIQSTPSDLSIMARDNTGYFKLSSVFAKETLPEFSSTAALPTHGATDAVFQITDASNNSTTSATTLSYLDWAGHTWNTQAWQGHLVGSTNIMGTPIDSISPTIEYQDWNAKKYLASRIGNGLFLISKGEPAAGETACAIDPVTGVTTVADVSSCSSYVSQSVRMLGPGNKHLTVVLAQKPFFTSLNSAAFSEQGPVQNFDISAGGSPAPVIAITQAPDVSQFNSLGSGSFGAGHARIQYFNGIGNTHHPGTYTAVVTATNGWGSVSQTITVVVGNPPMFSSPAFVDFFRDVPGSLTISTTGYPAPSISLDFSAGGSIGSGPPLTPAPPISLIRGLHPNLLLPPTSLPAGLTFTDNRNGTATVQGTPASCNTEDDIVLDQNTGTSNTITQVPNFPFKAANALGSATTGIGIGVFCPSPVTLTGADRVTFDAGAQQATVWTAKAAYVKHRFVNDHYELAYTPAKVHLACQIPAVLSFLQCSDDGNGTLTMSGSAPVSATSTNAPVIVTAHADGATSDPAPLSVLVTISPPRLMGTLGDVFFQPGAINLTHTFLASDPSTTFTATGTYPGSVSFTGTGALTVAYDGSPEGSIVGGYYPVTVNATGPYGTQTYSQRIYIQTPPAFVTDNQATFFTGAPNEFDVQTSGFPKSPVISGTTPLAAQGMTITLTGNLPQGVTFSSTNSQGQPTGTGVFAGTPCAACTGDYPITLTAHNLAGTATQNITLHVLASGTPLPSPAITWAGPAPITFGTPISATQLNATAGIPGQFAYTPVAGTVLNAGTQRLQVVFTPTDTANYSLASKSVDLVVNQATPGVDWPAPALIVAGTPLSQAQLNAISTLSGHFVYSPAAGTVLPVGNNQTLSVTFTPDDANYQPVTVTNHINVITPAPGAPTIVSGPANPSSSLAATFQFTGAEGTASFRCDMDGGVFSVCTSPFTVTLATPGPHTFGVRGTNSAGLGGDVTYYPWVIVSSAKVAAALGSKSSAAADGTMTVNVILTNSGTVSASSVKITGVTLRALTGSGSLTLTTPMPVNVGTIAAGSSVSVPLTIKVPLPLGSVTRYSATMNGSYTDGTTTSTFSNGLTVVP